MAPRPPLILEPNNASNEDALELLHETSSSTIENVVSTNKKVGYGTAGFREKVDQAPLTKIMTRTAAFAILRSLACGGEAVGIMITASHNDESYNGVKIADPDGGMMPPEWEATIVWVVNHEDLDDLWDWINKKKKEAKDNGGGTILIPTLYLGRDTRSHSSGFRDAMVKIALAMGARVVDLGVVTTPMLHHSVFHANSVNYLPKTLIPPRPYVAGYLDLLAYSYTNLVQTKKSSSPAASTTDPTNSTLLVDCACGVGYPALVELVARIQSIEPNAHRKIQITNGPGMGALNEGCGSEYVQKQIREPAWYETTVRNSAPKDYCASLDGDADRIVFFASPPSNPSDNDDDSALALCLLDGDRIACLWCEFVQGELQVLRRYVPNLPDLKLGLVQTAYANGASTRYLQTVIGSESVAIAKTGVKHLHAAAHDQFDIGIYFEANGHGTVLFGPAFYSAIDVAQQAITFSSDGPRDAGASTALQRLSLLPSLVNQAVGDALSDLLFVDAILYLKGWTLADWHKNQYEDYPSRQIKVRVADRTIIKTNDNETQCLAPANVQEELDQAMQQMIQNSSSPDAVARTFIRPSGTEDVVRIYAEASTRAEADQLAAQAAAIVHKLCDGIGELPSS